jgi:hypothetical protein
MILEIKKKFLVNGGSFDSMFFLTGEILLKIENERVKKKSLFEGTFNIRFF